MPNKKISELTEVTSIVGTDVLAIVNGGITKKIKADNLAAFVDPDATLRTLSADWQTTFSIVQSNSASWDYQGADLKSLSSDWIGGNVAFTNLVSNSAAYLSSVDLSFLSVSANWDSVYSTVQSNSASWVGGGGSSVEGLSANWESTYTTVNANSASWDYQGTDLKDLSSSWQEAYTNLTSNSAAYLSSIDLSFLSISANWEGTYTTVSSNSAKWESVYSNVVENSASYATINFANSKFFTLTGGTISGATKIEGNVTIYGDLSASGTQTFIDTVYATTSALSVVNIGAGTALTVTQQGIGNIATFYDVDQNLEILHVGCQNSTYPNVGIKISDPNKDFTVKGEISASSDIWTTGRIMSGGQELLSLFEPTISNIYNTVNANSATNWNYQGTDLKDLSANWESTYTTVLANSAFWGLGGGGGSYVGDLSANWESTYTTVLVNSASWDYQGNDLKSLSSDWVGGNAAFTNLVSNSAAYLSGVDLSFLSVSANWDSVYSSVASNSASYATIDFANSKFFALTGGLISGATRINGNVTIFGDLSSTGTQTFANTIFSTTSALSVVHTGSGPAVWIGNNGSGDIASFYDIDQDVEVLHIGGANGTYPNVGVKVSAPNKDFTVKGEISATGDIWTTGRILSGGQELLSLIQPSIDSLYSTVNLNSATAWNYQGTDLKGLSANWQNTYTTVNANSGKYENVSTAVQNISGAWNLSTITEIFSSSGTWTKPLSAKSVSIQLVGGGGGGGSGRKGATSTVRSGGGGGGGAGATIMLVDAVALSSTVLVTIGAGGAGGLSQTTNSTNGNAGADGGDTSFGIFRARGGNGGGAGSATTGSAGTAGAGQFAGGTGGTGGGSTASTNAVGATFISGGGGGGGIKADNTTFNASNGGFINSTSQSAAGGGASPSSPVPHGLLTALGQGGGGGNASTTGNGVSGAAGGLYGGGGGGGGGSTDSVGNSGAGGIGGNGIVIVTTYF